MGGPVPLPAASWLLDSAIQHVQRAHTLLDQANIADWRGPAAVAYRHAVTGLLAGTTALREELAEAARWTRAHEQDLHAVQAQYGDAR